MFKPVDSKPESLEVQHGDHDGERRHAHSGEEGAKDGFGEPVGTPAEHGDGLPLRRGAQQESRRQPEPDGRRGVVPPRARWSP
jgi:hypothetical protein